MIMKTQTIALMKNPEQALCHQSYPCLECKALQFASEFSLQTVGGTQTIQSGEKSSVKLGTNI